MRYRLAMTAAALALGVAALALSSTSVQASAALSSAPAASAALPRINHVFVIVLENEAHDTTFGPGSKAPYLATQLTAMGQHLDQYYGIGHNSLDNYVAMISGQAPNPSTQADCPVFLNSVATVPGPNGQAGGALCVYPGSVPTVAGQLTARGLTWKGYMEDMANSATEPKTCRHPALNQRDDTQSAHVGDQYAARHDPFVYFHSIIDSPICQSNVVALPALSTDLSSARTTPNLAFITPNLCHDGHDSPCVDGEPGGLVSADALLQAWVPKILGSAAYRDHGMLIVLFDESSVSDTAACCGEQPGVGDSPLPGITGPGGGRVGAVVLSRSVVPGSLNHTPYNHYSLLRTIEDLFALPHLGFAGQSGLAPFGRDVFAGRR
jgi:phosphatidylinositol-3-phosphatase